MSGGQFPAEVLENILQFLDGVSLCIAKRVCKAWLGLIKQMELNRRHWKTLCIREIPLYIIEEMVYFHDNPPRQTIVDWVSLYRRWVKGKISSDPSNFQITCTESSLTNPITCIAISGSFVITGHNNGYLSVWSHNTGLLMQRCRGHLKTVTAMTLVDLINLGAYYCQEDLFWSHHHLITVSKDSMIKVKFLLEPFECSQSDIVLNKHSDVIVSVRMFGDIFFANSRDNIVSLWKMKAITDPFLHLDITYLHTIVGPADIGLDFGLWYDELFCVSLLGCLQTYKFHNHEWSELTYFKKNWTKNKKLRINKCQNFRNKIIILFTVEGNMFVSLCEDNFKEYALFATLRTQITSVALKGTILALGGENGKLYLFYVPENRSLLELGNATSKITLSEASIVSIDILYELDYPIIVASTTNSIYVVKCHRKGRTFNGLPESRGTSDYQASTSICR